MLQQINPAAASPCNGFCEMDSKSHLCKGCFRTISEIVSWQMYSDKQKFDVLQRVKLRKEKAKNN